ncbi:MAG: endonuclease domain-containing protein [Candidatus Doudnabacteria bacterium]|jgi:very-short-patch-repair endonuclease
MHLKAGRFFGLKFKRQLTIGEYIYDFSCFEKKLIIELDGSGHVEPEVVLSDRKKQEFVERLGYKVIRFNNNDVQNNLDGVLERIHQLIS